MSGTFLSWRSFRKCYESQGGYDISKQTKRAPEAMERLFKEDVGALLHASPFEQQEGAPRVSEPERALLEVLSDVGVRQPLEEARDLTQSTHTLRADVLRELLRSCSSVKTVRLCLALGKEFELPWAEELDPNELPLGSSRPWVTRLPDGLLVLKR